MPHREDIEARFHARGQDQDELYQPEPTRDRSYSFELLERLERIITGQEKLIHRFTTVLAPILIPEEPVSEGQIQGVDEERRRASAYSQVLEQMITSLEANNKRIEHLISRVDI